MTTPAVKPGRLSGRVATVTGTSSGLGAAISEAFAREGATIFCIDLYPSPRNAINPATLKADDFNNRIKGQGTHERIRQALGEAYFHKADVTKARDIDFAIRACVQRYKRVDILVNCAGISVESTHIRALRAHETSEEDFDKTMAINTKGTFLACKYALKQMLEQEQLYGSRGWIINTASIQGMVPYYGTPSYCASKGAVVMLTKQIALDYAKDQIHANALCPGFLETSMTQNLQGEPETKREIELKHPFGERLGDARDVAKTAVFLASDDAAWVTGTNMVVDGGYMLR
ncbi:2-(R)-hydroxypropyl-CoM dehydrogenase [Cyphellophora attinorum]|uniref:2-(R)-hydroxypropyl-CoM dehydrogenase n=1 Tax=Cyphellophora attinorum TaxID=1664694 RepID=A0A0N0NP85_9EURO|nr:2-(R)-hydroxypropyl-CoM dehydrogenase [Phialophora attinorum]KPI42461.1 2-(R)-hydroxypropyl-CoM dehydrogenase [Phialophora attinorum]